ncbi:MAG: cytochrome c [Verrucomicrobia bacterium]|nr:cytochrome c [Verrucomicrobiota bacterium]
MKRIIALAVMLAVGSAMATYAADAKTIYAKDCAKCHGKEGKGDTKMGQKLGVKDYTAAKVQAEMKDEEAFKAIKEGYKDKAGKVVMKPAEGVTDDEIKALVKYMRSFKK